MTLDIENGFVRSAQVNSPLFRGFEQILLGKNPFDSLVFVPRICGICSVSQSAAAAAALAQAMGVAAPRNGELAHNLISGCENLADHFSHFYLFFMPDFAREGYARRPWFDRGGNALQGGERQRHRRCDCRRGATSSNCKAFSPASGRTRWRCSRAVRRGRSMRRSASASSHCCARFAAYLERTLFGDTLEAIVALDSRVGARCLARCAPSRASDFRRFLELARDCGLDRAGCGPRSYSSVTAATRSRATRFCATVSGTASCITWRRRR